MLGEPKACKEGDVRETQTRGREDEGRSVPGAGGEAPAPKVRRAQERFQSVADALLGSAETAAGEGSEEGAGSVATEDIMKKRMQEAIGSSLAALSSKLGLPEASAASSQAQQKQQAPTVPINAAAMADPLFRDNHVRECYYFFKTGVCRLAEKCPYSHERVDGQYTNRAEIAAAGWGCVAGGGAVDANMLPAAYGAMPLPPVAVARPVFPQNLGIPGVGIPGFGPAGLGYPTCLQGSHPGHTAVGVTFPVSLPAMPVAATAAGLLSPLALGTGGLHVGPPGWPLQPGMNR